MRYRGAILTKANADEVLALVKKEKRPWHRAQDLAHVLRYTARPFKVLTLLRSAAMNGADRYQQSAVRAWEIEALSERGMLKEARKSLAESLSLASEVSQAGSRAEAMFMLFRAGWSIGRGSAEGVFRKFSACCDGEHGHWRCKRAQRHMIEMLEGECKVWKFFHD
jgi:hypothetical protein